MSKELLCTLFVVCCVLLWLNTSRYSHSWRCGCLATSFVISWYVKQGNKTVTLPWPYPYHSGLPNLLAPGRPRCHFKTATFNLVFLIGIFTSSKDNALRWMPRDLTDDKSTLVQVMAWCRQAISHYLSQCWPSSMASPGHNELTINRSYQNKTKHNKTTVKSLI